MDRLFELNFEAFHRRKLKAEAARKRKAQRTRSGKVQPLKDFRGKKGRSHPRNRPLENPLNPEKLAYIRSGLSSPFVIKASDIITADDLEMFSSSGLLSEDCFMSLLEMPKEDWSESVAQTDSVSVNAEMSDKELDALIDSLLEEDEPTLPKLPPTLNVCNSPLGFEARVSPNWHLASVKDTETSDDVTSAAHLLLFFAQQASVTAGKKRSLEDDPYESQPSTPRLQPKRLAQPRPTAVPRGVSPPPLNDKPEWLPGGGKSASSSAKKRSIDETEVESDARPSQRLRLEEPNIRSVLSPPLTTDLAVLFNRSSTSPPAPPPLLHQFPKPQPPSPSPSPSPPPPQATLRQFPETDTGKGAGQRFG
ncbi:hypothetical protein HDU96_005414 [Phlyctochytrium bullatum]|nr:hypothetical protein HDU96_005414 [Phlyctochytrium bullatum]